MDDNKKRKEYINFLNSLGSKEMFNLDTLCFIALRERGISRGFTKKYLEEAIQNGFFRLNEDNKVCLPK